MRVLSTATARSVEIAQRRRSEEINRAEYDEQHSERL
jgi:hypothetical protein